ncbi:phenylalanine--tRNA ligase subunit beta, partial [Brevibacterium paucivorans]
LPTLVDAQLRNQGRGFKDTALFEIGLVTQPETAQLPASETFAPGYHPTEEERAAIFDAVPHQPLHAAGIVSGNWELEGVWGKGRKAEAMDAI